MIGYIGSHDPYEDGSLPVNKPAYVTNCWVGLIVFLLLTLFCSIPIYHAYYQAEQVRQQVDL